MAGAKFGVTPACRGLRKNPFLWSVPRLLQVDDEETDLDTAVASRPTSSVTLVPDFANQFGGRAS